MQVCVIQLFSHPAAIFRLGALTECVQQARLASRSRDQADGVYVEIGSGRPLSDESLIRCQRNTRRKRAADQDKILIEGLYNRRLNYNLPGKMDFLSKGTSFTGLKDAGRGGAGVRGMGSHGQGHTSWPTACLSSYADRGVSEHLLRRN